MALVTYGEWPKWRKLLNPSRFKSDLVRELRRAMSANVVLVRKEIIDRIDHGAYAANAPLTILLKGSGLPLVDKGDLRRTIQGKVVSWNEGLVGLLRTGGAANIGAILHEGATVKVTAKMRGWFKAQSGKGVKPLKPSTTQIRIPGRPFIKDAIELPAVITAVQRNYREGVRAALHDQTGTYVKSI